MVVVGVLGCCVAVGVVVVDAHRYHKQSARSRLPPSLAVAKLNRLVILLVDV